MGKQRSKTVGECCLRFGHKNNFKDLIDLKSYIAPQIHITHYVLIYATGVTVFIQVKNLTLRTSFNIFST